MEHPQCNEQLETTNKVILVGIKEEIGLGQGKVARRLARGIVGIYRFTTRSSTKEIPFSLVYDTYAMILVEIGEPSLQ